MSNEKLQELNKKIKKLEEEVEKLKKQSKEYLEGWKRARADYANLKDEIEKEKELIIKFANTNLFSEIIPILHNFKNALENLPDIKDKNFQNWILGIKQIYKQFENILKKYNVEIVGKKGEVFNPEIHEAVLEETADKPGIVLKVVALGYKIDGKLILPAKVVVSKKKR